MTRVAGSSTKLGLQAPLKASRPSQTMLRLGAHSVAENRRWLSIQALASAWHSCGSSLDMFSNSQSATRTGSGCAKAGTLPIPSSVIPISRHSCFFIGSSLVLDRDREVLGLGAGARRGADMRRDGDRRV